MNLLIIGAGQYGMVAKEIAIELGYKDVAFLDDNSSLAIGKISDVDKFDGDVIIAIGNSYVRETQINHLLSFNRLVTLISPHAYVSPSAKINSGCIIEPMAVVHTGAKIGNGCIISAGAVVNHGCVLEDFCHIDCNATVMKSAVVPKGTKIESNTSFSA